MSEHVEKRNWIRRHPGYSLLIVVFGILFALYQIGAHDESNQSEPQESPEMIAAQQKIDARAAALRTAQLKEQAAQIAADQKAWDTSAAGKLCKAHPLWSKDACTTIANGKVYIGMDQEQAKAAWGAPEDINRTTTVNGVSEQWVYNGNYLYFDGGILTSIQN